MPDLAQKTLYHGGAPDMWPRTKIVPGLEHRRYHPGCPQCEAQKQGVHIAGFDPPTPHGWVYATTDLPYARYYASRYGKGWLYEVELLDGVEESTEDCFPTWRARRGRVIKVLEKRVTLTWPERRELFVRWGGTEGEFNAMLLRMGVLHIAMEQRDA